MYHLQCVNMIDMKKLILCSLVFILLFSLFSCAPEGNKIHPDTYFDYQGWIDENKEKEGDIVFMGDSRVALFDCTAYFHPENKTVLGLGVGGEVVRGVRKRLDVLEKIRPESLFIAVGGNDVSYDDFSYETFEDDYRMLLDRIIELEVPRAYIQTITGLSNPKHLHLNRKIALCNTIIEGLVSEYNSKHSGRFVFLDIAAEMDESDGKGKNIYMADDGVHFSEEGNDFWAEYLKIKCIELN